MELEPLLEAFLDRVHVATYLQDCDQQVIYINPAATRLTGWHLADLIGRQGHRIFGGSVACPCEACRSSRGDGSGVPRRVLEGTIRTRAGALLPVRVGVCLFEIGPGESGTVVMIEDLSPTGPAATEASIDTGGSSCRPEQAALERLVDILFDAIPDGISILDPDLTIRRVNRTMTEWYRDCVPLVGRRCYNCYQNRIGPCLNCPSLRCFASGRVECEIVAGPAGSPVERIELTSFPLKDPAGGKVCQVVEVVRDITARAQLENCRIIVSEVVDRVRALCRRLENGAVPESSPASPADPALWRAQADELVSFCDQVLSRWSDGDASGNCHPTIRIRGVI